MWTHWRNRDPGFRTAYDEAMAEAFEGLLDVAMEPRSSASQTRGSISIHM